MSEEKRIKVHWILDQADHALIEALANIEGVKIVQSDFPLTALRWILHNEGEEIDVSSLRICPGIQLTVRGKQLIGIPPAEGALETCI